MTMNTIIITTITKIGKIRAKNHITITESTESLKIFLHPILE